MRWFGQSRNARTGVICSGLVFGMTGLAYASVPLYRMFCQLTGFAGTPQIAEGAEAPGAVGRTISIRFDANTDSQLPWVFGRGSHGPSRSARATSPSTPRATPRACR